MYKKRLEIMHIIHLIYIEYFKFSKKCYSDLAIVKALTCIHHSPGCAMGYVIL